MSNFKNLEMKYISFMMRKIRIQKGVTQEDLGKKLEKKKAQISKIERAKCHITCDYLISFVKEMEININDIIPEIGMPEEILQKEIDKLDYEIYTLIFKGSSL